MIITACLLRPSHPPDPSLIFIYPIRAVFYILVVCCTYRILCIYHGLPASQEFGELLARTGLCHLSIPHSAALAPHRAAATHSHRAVNPNPTPTKLFCDNPRKPVSLGQQTSPRLPTYLGNFNSYEVGTSGLCGYIKYYNPGIFW